MGVSIGQKIPDLSLPATGGRDISLSGYAGKKLVVYFYPKDNTPGCTQEGQDFRDLYEQFQQRNCEILGISRDSVRSHEGFREKYGFPYPLLSDSQTQACHLFGVIKEKNMYGRKVTGVERSTFLIDAQCVLRQEWRGVQVKGHAAEVLEAVGKI